MRAPETYLPSSEQSVILWLAGFQSPPPSPVEGDPLPVPTSLKSDCFPRKRAHCDSMSRSPKKRKTNPQSESIPDTLSDYSLPPPSSDRVRPSSPPRELREIYRYAKPPIQFITTPDEHTPISVLDIYKNIQKAYAAVIPESLKVCAYSGRDGRVIDF
jgi:hypothetical protein